ncbi:MAG: hypothetical protein AAF382_12730 [Pseudomonadota bacterium]
MAFVKVANIPKEIKIYDAYTNHVPDVELHVAKDVFVLGYPRGMIHQGIFPIWKRASIASEPSISRDDGLPMFLVDTATREGMSGAPVFAYDTGSTRLTNGNIALSAGATRHFCGIYSGRYGSDVEDGIQLGRVWSESAVVEMIDDPAVGSHTLSK